ncbi:uncharacterized protein BO80DRAFT_6667 [Aspergillus ibericus CBS 121593]|uniref:Uncharacterized protein n=1 Tax=Aspergillus ibericus CBS 121593 TaxID=1448316 RepID=A0A395HEJ3_9EURO|nr:hypothetical protein BO80DRAFT_6667 [Aspergillus ibericus CBS 121593]RAL06282.1 hypothetical protein BO80DRAFT_6667 [Aspergillus ibericus CBS 121593]
MRSELEAPWTTLTDDQTFCTSQPCLVPTIDQSLVVSFPHLVLPTSFFVSLCLLFAPLTCSFSSFQRPILF